MSGRIFCPVVTQDLSGASYLCEVLLHSRGHALRLSDDDAWLVQVVPSLLDQREAPPVPVLEALHPAQARTWVDGRSGRLARALSSVGSVCHRTPTFTVVATGDLDENGRVLAVERLHEKLERLLNGLTRAGVADEPVLCLIPGGNANELDHIRASLPSTRGEHITMLAVETFDEAVDRVYGRGSHPGVTEIGRLRSELERLRFVQARWGELLEVAGRLVSVATRSGHRVACYHGLLLAWAALRNPPSPTVDWLGQAITSTELRSRLDAELDQLESSPSISDELRAERLNYQAIDTLGHDHDLRFQRGLLLADAALALSPEDGHAREHRKILGTRAQLRTAFALRQHAFGNDVDALELARAALADAERSHALAPQEPASSENDAARVRVYAFAAADVLEALGGPSRAREHYEEALLRDLGPYAPNGPREAHCVQDPTWALQKLIPSWLRRLDAHECARRLRHVLDVDAALGRIRHSDRLGFLMAAVASASGDDAVAASATGVAPESPISLRTVARWGGVTDTGATYSCQAAGASQVVRTDVTDGGRRRLRLWCGEALGLVPEHGSP